MTSDIVGGESLSLTEQVSFLYGELHSDVTVGGTTYQSCWKVTNTAC